MPIPSRILRDEVEDLLGRPPFTDRQRDRDERILSAAELLLAKHGRHAVTWRGLAESLRMAGATMRWHYTDLDALLAAILTRHLRAIAKALGAVPRETPNRRHAQCLAYLAATRLPFGGFTPAHLLLTRDRHSLPEDVLGPVEQYRQSLGLVLAGDLGDETLERLDTPWLTAETLSPILELLISPPPPLAQPEPVQTTPAITRRPDLENIAWLRPAGLGSLADPFPEPPLQQDPMALMRDEALMEMGTG